MVPGDFELWKLGYEKAMLEKFETESLLESGRATPSPYFHHLSVNPQSGRMEPVPPLQIQLLNDKAQAPTRGSAFAAGYDLYSAVDDVVPARGKAMVSTGIAIAVPAGTCKYPLPSLLKFHRSMFRTVQLTLYSTDGRVAPRSGLAAKHSIDTGAGVIDADYRGEVRVILFNFSDKDFEIKSGDRIAQLVIERIYTPEVLVVKELDASVRGAGGFGSTGGFGSGSASAGAANGA